MSLSECFPNDNNLLQHKDEESFSSQGNSLQDDSGHGLTLDGIYGGDNMSEGDLEDDLEYPYIHYQAPTAPQQTERINSDLGSRTATSLDCCLAREQNHPSGNLDQEAFSIKVQHSGRF